MNFKIDSNEVENIKIEKLEIFSKNEEEEKIKKLFKSIRFLEIIPMIYTISYFIMNGYYKISMSKKFNLPREYFKLSLNEIITYLTFLILFPLIFFLMSIYFKKDNFISKLLEFSSILLLFFVELSFLNVLANIYILFIFIAFIIFYILLFFISFKNKNIILTKIRYLIYFIHLLFYIIFVSYYWQIISSKYEIFYKDNELKLVITTYEGKYLIMDGYINQKELTIYTEKYKFIDINEVEFIQYKNFNNVKCLTKNYEINNLIVNERLLKVKKSLFYEPIIILDTIISAKGV